MGDVPSDWQVVRIKRTADLRSDRCAEASDGAQYIGLEDVESGTGQYRPTVGSARQNENSTVGVFKTGDVLYGKLRPYLKKAIVSDADGVCSTEFLVLQPKTVISPWLHQWLLTTGVTQQIEAGCEGAKMPRADCGARQGSCRLIHAASGLVSQKNQNNRWSMQQSRQLNLTQR